MDHVRERENKGNISTQSTIHLLYLHDFVFLGGAVLGGVVTVKFDEIIVDVGLVRILVIRRHVLGEIWRVSLVKATHQSTDGEGCAAVTGRPVQLTVIRVYLAVATADGFVPPGASPRTKAHGHCSVR